MKKNTVITPPGAYEIVFVGKLDSGWSHWFEGWDLSWRDDGTTVLIGPVVDQAELHGLLAKIQNLNLPLISVNPVSPPESKLASRLRHKICSTPCGIRADRRHVHSPTDERRRP
jgi:hypothetical protein